METPPPSSCHFRWPPKIIFLMGIQEDRDYVQFFFPVNRTRPPFLRVIFTVMKFKCFIYLDKRHFRCSWRWWWTIMPLEKYHLTCLVLRTQTHGEKHGQISICTARTHAGWCHETRIPRRGDMAMIDWHTNMAYEQNKRKCSLFIPCISMYFPGN